MFATVGSDPFRRANTCGRVQGSAFRVEGAGLRVEGRGLRVEGAGLRVEGAELRVQSSKCRVQGSGFRTIPVLSGDNAVGVEHGHHFEEKVVAQHPRSCRMSWCREITHLNYVLV